MPDDDDVLLRQMFEREARLVPYAHEAHAALATIEPALRRAAIKRASLIAASAALVLGGGVAAFDAVRVDDGALGVVARPTPTESVPPITAPAAVVPATSAAPDDTEAEHADDADAATGTSHSPSHVVGDEGDTGQRATVAPPPTEPEPTQPPAAATATPVPAPTAAPQPPTTAAPTTTTTLPPPSTPVRYDSDCGVVTADLTTSPPTLLEIAPRDGFRVQVEDPDHGRIVVHFAGHDQECEIQVGVPTSEPHESVAVGDEQPDD